MDRHRGPVGSAGGAWLVLAVLLVFSGTASAQVITSLSAIPNPFSPNGDGMLDGTTITCGLAAAADSLELRIRGEMPGESWSLMAQALEAGTHAWAWAGTTSAGGVFSDGVHSLNVRVFAGGAASDSAVRLIATDVSPPRIRDFQQIRSAFAPDASLWNLTGLRFGIETGGPAADTTRVLVVDLEGPTLVSLGGFGGARTETTFYWDGRDQEDALLEEGTYSLKVTAADEAGNRDEEVGLVYLDLGGPRLGAAADTLFSTAFPETVLGWASDPSGVDQVLARESEGQWEVLEVAAADSVSWTFVLGDSSSGDGWYGAEVKALDVFGHEGDTLRLTIGKASYTPIPVRSYIISPDTIFADGEKIEITSEWDQAGYDIDADFSKIDSKYSPDRETVVDNKDSTYSISYMISSTNTRENASGLAIRITATHIYRTDSAFVWAELRNETGPQVPGGVTLDRNLFNPEEGQVLTIGFPASNGGTTVEIYTLVGERVARLEAGAGREVQWAGRNSEDETVASGVYLVRVRGDGFEVVRKVGVVK